MAAAWDTGPAQAQPHCPLSDLGARVLGCCKLMGLLEMVWGFPFYGHAFENPVFPSCVSHLLLTQNASLLTILSVLQFNNPDTICLEKASGPTG